MINFMMARVYFSMGVFKFLPFGAIPVENRDSKVLLPYMNIYYQYHCHLDTFTIIAVNFDWSLLFLLKAI